MQPRRRVAVAALALSFSPIAFAQGGVGSGVAASGFFIPLIYEASSTVPAGGSLEISVFNANGIGVNTNVPLNSVRLRDAAAVVVWTGPATPVLAPPQQVTTFHCPGTDAAGAPLPPGPYAVEALLPAGWTVIQTAAFGAVGAPADLTRLPFNPTIGSSRILTYQNPADGLRPYVFALSFGAVVGISTCAGSIPIDYDPLMQYCFGPQNVVGPLTGWLDAGGRTNSATAPHLQIPNDPAIAGLTVYGCFVVLDLSAPCWFRSLGAAHPITFTPFF